MLQQIELKQLNIHKPKKKERISTHPLHHIQKLTLNRPQSKAKTIKFLKRNRRKYLWPWIKQKFLGRTQKHKLLCFFFLSS